MLRRYQEWMYRWEDRLTSRDTNRVVRPFEWGLEWCSRWPGVDGEAPAAGQDGKEFFFELERENSSPTATSSTATKRPKIFVSSGCPYACAPPEARPARKTS